MSSSLDLPSAAAKSPMTALFVGSVLVLLRANRDESPHDWSGPAKRNSKTIATPPWTQERPGPRRALP